TVMELRLAGTSGGQFPGLAENRGGTKRRRAVAVAKASGSGLTERVRAGWVRSDRAVNSPRALNANPGPLLSRGYPDPFYGVSMAFFTASDKGDFHRQLEEVLARHVEPGTLPRLARFAEQFFAIAPLDELQQRRLGDLEGSTLSAWRLLEAFRGEPVVRVFNPDYEQHGWQSAHSVVQVLHPDMPFLVDSVRMALNRRGHSIHTLQNSVLTVRRGADGALLDVLP